jgi:hypothetical protein
MTMRFNVYLQRLRPSLDQAIADCVGVAAADMPEGLQQPLQRALADGKRLRAGILCLVTEALGGSLTAALPRAAAIECIQAASLIHDDYVDADTMRRQRPATWTLIGARKAVLLGDLLFATAIERMMILSADDGRVIVHAIATVAKGAYQEPMAHSDLAGDPAEAYERIIYLKTGALFAAAAELGAIAAGAGDEHHAAAQTFGARLGEAYQIADDLHDLTALQCVPAQPLPPPLIPALLRFAPRSADMNPAATCAGFDSARLSALLPALRTRMQLALAERAVAAATALASLPDNRARLLLRTAVTEITAAGNHETFPAPVTAGV